MNRNIIKIVAAILALTQIAHSYVEDFEFFDTHHDQMESLPGTEPKKAELADLFTYVGLVKEDAKTGDDVKLDKPLYVRDRHGLGNEKLCGYTMYKTDNKLPFKVELLEPLTGAARIVVADSDYLDFEAHKEYSFELAPHDCEKGSHGRRERVVIKVMDVNDNSPQWTAHVYEAEMEEQRIYSNIVRLTAIDGDVTEAFNKICRYFIVDPPNVPFSIDEEGFLRNTEPLDFTKRSNYELNVKAEDCGGRQADETARVIVKVKQSCRPHWIGIQDTQNYEISGTATRLHRRPLLFQEAQFDLCGLDDCNITQISATVHLITSPYESSPSCDVTGHAMAARQEACQSRAEAVKLLHYNKVKPQITDHHETRTDEDETDSDDKEIFSFDGDSHVIDVAVNGIFENFTEMMKVGAKTKFTVMTWLKMRNINWENAKEKQAVLCLSDGEGMNRHQLSLQLLHSCRLQLLIHRSAAKGSSGQSEMSFEPAEWRWQLEDSCDSDWHHYTINVDYPEVSLYIDGKPVVANDESPEIVDDWPLYEGKHHGAMSHKLTVGACWQGRSRRYKDFLTSSLAGLTLLVNQLESDHVIHCVSDCSERLDFTSLQDMGITTSVSMNNERTTVVVTGRSHSDVERLVKRIVYVNNKLTPLLGRRLLNIETHAKCGTNELTMELATASLNVVEKQRTPIKKYHLALKAPSVLNTDQNTAILGLKLFSQLTMELNVTVMKEVDENDDVDETENKEKPEPMLDGCKIQASPKLNVSWETLSYSQNFLHDFKLKAMLTEQGLDIQGQESLSVYEDLLKGLEYRQTEKQNTNARPTRDFTLSCEVANITSNKLDVTLTIESPTHIREELPPKAAAILSNKQMADEPRVLWLDKIMAENNQLERASSRQIGGSMALGILVCVGLMLFVSVLGVMKMRSRRRQMTGGHGDVAGAGDDKPEMEWDNSALTITVNPLEQQMYGDDSLIEESYAGCHGDATDSEDEQPDVSDGEGQGHEKSKSQLEWDDSVLSY